MDADTRTAGDFEARMREVLARQKHAHIKDGPPSAAKRIEWIDRAIALIVDNQEAIAEALREDFGHRSVHASLFTDVAGSIGFASAKLGRRDEARAWYSKALAADPNHVATLGNSGALYVAQGDLATRRGDERRAAALYRQAAEALQDFRF